MDLIHVAVVLGVVGVDEAVVESASLFQGILLDGGVTVHAVVGLEVDVVQTAPVSVLELQSLGVRRFVGSRFVQLLRVLVASVMGSQD